MTRIPYSRVLVQILIWMLVWLTLTVFLTNSEENIPRIVRRSTINIIGIAIIVVVNLLVLLPKIYFKKRIALYIIAACALLVLVNLFLHSDYSPFSYWDYGRITNRPPPDPPRGGPGPRPSSFFWMARSIPLLLTLLGSTLVEVSRFANLQEKQAIQSSKEKLETELKFLKSQINPHFLFNALNNIYTLTVIKSDVAPESLLRLSEMLRYMLYDSNEEKVPLSKEIAYLKNYTELFLLKDSRGLDITLELDESRPDLPVAPLLFIPFIENAFKHSKIEDRESASVRIELQTGEQHITFSVLNTVPAAEFAKDHVGGIGLVNVRQRLDLLYPNRHELTIDQQTDHFHVTLNIDLS